MSAYRDHFTKVITFLQKYQSLVDCHVADFLTHSLWERCLPEDLRLYIEGKGHNVMNEIDDFNKARILHDSELHMFLEDAQSLALENCSNIITRHKLLKILDYDEHGRLEPMQSKFMKVKKWHEVDIFTRTIEWLNQNETSIIIDAGAGKGYSSLYLANSYDLPVLAIEGSQINHEGAIVHRDLVHKRKGEISSKIQYAVARIDEKTNYHQMVENHFPDLYLQRKLVLTALHACGPLTDSVIKSFLHTSEISRLCIVPCCYHLASKSLLSTYEFSRNARMLAQQSVARNKDKNGSISPSLFFRAVLQTLMQTLGIRDKKIGRGAPVDNFLIYAKWAFKKINAHEMPSDKTIEKIYKDNDGDRWKFELFQSLRIQLAPVIEAAILLDKVLFIQNSNLCEELEIVQLFDPLLSPRSWAVIAKK